MIGRSKVPTIMLMGLSRHAHDSEGLSASPSIANDYPRPSTDVFAAFNFPFPPPLSLPARQQLKSPTSREEEAS